jgi:hypothetical protein
MVKQEIKRVVVFAAGTLTGAALMALVITLAHRGV